MAEKTVRLSVPLEPQFHRKLQELFPTGTKAEIVRSLLETLLMTVQEDGQQIVFDVLRHNAKIVPKKDQG